MNRSLLPDELVSFDSDAYHSAGAQLWRGAGPGGHRMCSLTIECVLTALELNFGAALDRVVTAAKTIANARHASIFFLEKTGVAPGGLQSNTIHSYGLRLKGRGTQDKVFPCEGLAGICAAENMPVFSNRPHHDARFNPDIDWAPGAGVKSVACAPMTNICGKVVGVVQVCNKVHGGFTDEDLHFLDMLARQV